MKLILDIGNTRIKAGLFDQNELKNSFAFNSFGDLFTAGVFEKYSIEHCIVGSVVNEMEPFITRLKEKTDVLVFSAGTQVPIKNLYGSAHTLGSDRLAGAIGGNLLHPDKNVLVIDAGTCIKYNFVNSRNEYIGGAISPGLQMRFKAMHTFTSRLPLLEVDENYQKLIGTNSTESMMSGAEIGAVAEVEGFITLYKEQYPDINVLITGGDVNFFAKRLKNSIFADQFLILKGLNAILNYNIKNQRNKF
ncbi:MAG: type III pantothenate kinase [Bacteroidia bacterium]